MSINTPIATNHSKTIQRILEHFSINQKQALFIYDKFLYRYETQKEFDKFFYYYLDTLLEDKIVGTSFEKIMLVARKAEIELIGRYINKDIFYKWLEKKYKGKSFFRVYAKDFTYKHYYETYNSYTSQYETIETKENCDEFIVAFNDFGNLSQINFLQSTSPIENGEFKETLIEYIFKNQDRLEKDLLQAFKPLSKIKTEQKLKQEMKLANEMYHSQSLISTEKTKGSS